MSLRLLLLAAVLPAASCSSRPPAETFPSSSSPDPRRVQDDEIVALWDGRPLSWRAVAERLMQGDFKYAVDEYIRGKIVEERRDALGIVNTPEEMRRRAETIVRHTRAEVGDEVFRAMLARERLTEEAYLDHLRGSGRLSAALILEKIARYQAVIDGWMEIDWLVFAREDDAKAFAADCGVRGFDAAAAEMPASRPSGTMRRLREVFSTALYPVEPLLDPPIGERLKRLKPGETTGVEPSRSNLYYVIRLLDARPARAAPYADVQGEVFEFILAKPPSTQELRNWVNREFSRAKVEYRSRPDESPKR